MISISSILRKHTSLILTEKGLFCFSIGGFGANLRADLRAKTFSLTAHIGHHLRARNAVGITGEVLHFRRRCPMLSGVIVRRVVRALFKNA